MRKDEYSYDEWLKDDVMDGVKPVTMDNLRCRLRAQAIRNLRTRFKGDDEKAKAHLKNLKVVVKYGEIEFRGNLSDPRAVMERQAVIFQMVDPFSQDVLAGVTLWMVPNDQAR